MPKTDKTKERIFYVLEYLRRNSGPNSPIKANQLVSYLESEHDIAATRKTINSDINTLLEVGYDIVIQRGRTGGYYIASDTFQLPEVKLLINAVQSSKYLTERKSKELIEKLCSFTNTSDAVVVRNNVMISGRVKTMNESIYYNVDAIQEAISNNLQISFRYFDIDINKQRKFRNRIYEASPYGLVQDNENCYLLAYSERHGVTHYRVDRMTDIVILEEKRVYCRELSGKAMYDHAKKSFQMFSGNEADVRLRFHNRLANVVFDRFGMDTTVIPDGEDHFIARVSVDVSPMFLSWVIGFGKDAQILSPESVVDECKKLLLEVTELYKGEE